MNQLKRISVSTLLLLCFFMRDDGIAQLAIGQWRDHLSYKKGISVTQNDSLIYCATESGIFSLNKYDNAIERLSKISGLSDVGVNTIRYNDYNSTLLIAYKNANIDLVSDNTIYNISDIKRAIITGVKTLNNIHFKNELAYLACGFGIVVLDMDKREIKDTYYIGVNGGYINIRDITSDANYLYAATDSGVYRASFSSSNLADYNSWSTFSSLSKGKYNTLVSFAGKIYTNYSAPSTAPWPADTIYEYDGNQWKNFVKPDTAFYPIHKLDTGYDRLLISNVWGTDIYNSTQAYIGRINIFTTGFDINPYQSIIDKNNPDMYWIADNNNGLIKSYKIGSGSEAFAPNGPNTSGVYSMDMVEDELWVARGDRSEIWIGTYNSAEAYNFSHETWASTKSGAGGIAALDSIYDIVTVSIDPANKEHVYLGSLGAGIIELNNGTLTKLWNETNSSLQSRGDASFHWVGVFGMTHDKSGNLWATNSYATNPLSVRKTDGTWQSFNFSGIVTTPTISQVLITQSNQKWMVLPRGGGLLVFNENGTWATNDDSKKKLLSGEGNGNLPTNEITCLAEDKDGEIWVGTNKGIAVFFCADQVFSASGCEAQQIYIEQDGHTQILLETEVVTTIVIDGANRKWMGTQNSGAYLMSEDGTTEVKHFTAENSPLLSNEVRSIAINPKTGEVFFGTTEGIISYRNDATEGIEDFADVYVFPNPIRPGYEGPIAITGLVENADVKITDISGSLVYHTKALGGQAIWYGKNFSGEKASSGVYMVFCANEDGSKTYIAKILLVN